MLYRGNIHYKDGTVESVLCDNFAFDYTTNPKDPKKVKINWVSFTPMDTLGNLNRLTRLIDGEAIKEIKIKGDNPPTWPNI